ncbi:RHS repeat-associated core domain-containing protein, partial [Elizabethkingia bruuniana]
NYTDHLGNVRLSYTKGASGGAEIIEENNYYPFGLKHQGYNSNSLANSAYQYKYQGQELQENGWYSFKWRNYIPELGRFFNIDQLGEKYEYQSPYNFSENQVTAFVELEGLEKGLPWYLNENKYGGKPVLTLGAHNIKLPYAQRDKYSGNIIDKTGTFLSNTLGSIYNGVASTWNDAMEGKDGTSAVFEGDREMESTVRHVARGNVNIEEVEGLAAAAIIHKTVRSSNKLKPNKEAVGDHSSFDRDVNGNIYKYETYEKTNKGYFNPTKRFDGGKKDGSPGAAHVDRKTKKSVTTPHVQTKEETRKPTPEELPKNARFIR